MAGKAKNKNASFEKHGYEYSHGYLIRRLETAGGIRYQTDLGSIGGKKSVRKTFKTKTKARGCAEARKLELSRHGLNAKLLPDAQRIDALAGLEALKDFDVTIHAACEFYAKHHKKVDRNNGVSHLIDSYLEFQAQRVADGKLRPRSQQDMVKRLKPLSEKLGHLAVDVVSADDLEKMLSEYKPQNRSNYQRYFSMFFRWCVRRDLCTVNPVDRMEAVVLSKESPHIYSPEQTKAIMANAPDKMVAYFALAFFGGVRPDEILRLDWSDIELTDGIVHIRAAVSKTKRPRYIEMPKNLREWLVTVPHREGLVFPHSESSLHRWRSKAYKDANVPSLQDGARHSMATYYLALHSIEETTELLGHADTVLFRHYRGVAKGKKTKAKKYFAIRPNQKADVVEFVSKEAVA